jgi:energy-coupling factor transporter ATP-binding protein EcfA2
LKIYNLKILNFRGFEQIEIKPKDHVFLVGQPGSGRSDIIEALWRVLSQDSTRFPLSDDLDFHKRDLSKRIDIEVVLGGLGPNLEQSFFDYLEKWDRKEWKIVESISPPDSGENGEVNPMEWVLRLCYRAAWENDRQQAQHWIDFPKLSDPDNNDYKRISKDLRSQIPVVLIDVRALALSLGARGDLRQIVDLNQQADFSSSLDRFVSGIDGLAAQLIESKDLVASLEKIIDPLRVPLGIGTRTVSETVRFAPEGGSLSGILRGLQATIKVREDFEFLPLQRHGSTINGLFQIASALAKNDKKEAIILVDDFGDGIDFDSAMHFVSVLRNRSEQLWLSTRNGSLGKCFSLEEMIRLTVTLNGIRKVYAGQKPATKAERIAARHFHLQLLPAISTQTVVIVEGPHDRSALTAASSKLNREENVELLEASRISLLDAGAVDQSGGHTAIPRLAKLSKTIGFYVISLIDWDNDEITASNSLREALENSDVVIRWPRSYAIERAILFGLDDATIRTAVTEVSTAFNITLSFDPDSHSGESLIKQVVKFLKLPGGFHSPFIEALPEGCHPPMLRKCLEEMRLAVAKTGHVQLEN